MYELSIDEYHMAQHKVTALVITYHVMFGQV